jgi:hypothetical protein
MRWGFSMAKIVTSDYKLVEDGVVELQSPGRGPLKSSAEMSVSVGHTVVDEQRPAVLMWRMHVVGGEGVEYKVYWKLPRNDLLLWSTPDGGISGNVMVSLQELVDSWPIKIGALRFVRVGHSVGRLFISDVVLFYARSANI